MANRYWVGGTGSWSGTNTANWSDTSGGTGGFSVPTSADDVFFDANSGTGTATITTSGLSAKSLNCTGYTGTFAGTAAFTVAGSVTWGAGMTLSYSGALTVSGTGTYTSNGKSRGGTTTISGSGITVTLGDAFISTGALTVTNGTFDTAGYAVTATSLNATGSFTRVLLLRSSAITLTGSSTVTNISGVATLTFNAGTSTITCSNANAKALGNTAAAGNSITYYDVVSTGTGTLVLTNNNVFNSVTVANTTATSVRSIYTDADQTIGTLNLNGGAPTQRVKFHSSIDGIPRTITLNSFGTSVDCDFEDIVVTGAAAGTSITRAGDHGGNSGISFPAPKTVYWNLAGTNGYAANGWAATSGGTPSANNFPLAQDTAVVDNSSAGTGWTSYPLIFVLGTVDMSSRTTAFNINFSSGSVELAGSFKAGVGNTFTTSSGTAIRFVGGGAAVLKSNGRSINHDVVVACRAGGSVTLDDALSLANSGCVLNVNNGAFYSAGYTIAAGGLIASANATVVLGTSTVSISGSSTNALTLSNSAPSFSGAGSTITFLSSSATTFAGNGNTFGTVTIAGGTGIGSFTVTGSNTFGTLSSTRTAAYSLLFTGGTTQTFTNFDVSGSADAVVTVGSTNTTQVTLRKPIAWNIGANSTDGGNNTGLSFTGTYPDYLSVSRITAQLVAAAAQTINPARFDNSQEFYSPTVGVPPPPPQIAQPPLLSSSTQLFAPAVTSSAAVVAPLVGSTAAVYAPAAINSNTAQPPYIPEGSTVYAPTATALSTLSPPRIESTTQFYSASAFSGISAAGQATATVTATGALRAQGAFSAAVAVTATSAAVAGVRSSFTASASASATASGTAKNSLGGFASASASAAASASTLTRTVSVGGSIGAAASASGDLGRALYVQAALVVAAAAAGDAVRGFVASGGATATADAVADAQRLANVVGAVAGSLETQARATVLAVANGAAFVYISITSPHLRKQFFVTKVRLETSFDELVAAVSVDYITLNASVSAIEIDASI